MGPVTPPLYTITWDKNDGTGTISTSTFSAGGSVTAPNPTRANYTLDGFRDTTSGTFFYSVAGGGSFSPPNGSRTMYARWTYSPPSYTFVFGNKISVSTNGYISLGNTTTVTENKTTTAAATLGKVLAILPHDARQTSLYYYSDTVKYVVRWIGATYNAPTETMAYEVAFYKDQQYADFKILNRSVPQQSNAAYMVDAYTGSGVITSYPVTPTELSRFRVHFNGTTPTTPVTYSELSLSVMKRDTTQDGADDETTTLTTATNQTAFIAPHFPPFFPPFFPPHFPPFFPPHFPPFFPPFFPPHFPPFFPPHFPPFFPPYFASVAPAVPTGLSINGSGLMTWNAVAGATGYRVTYWLASSATGDDEFSAATNIDVGNVTSFQVTYANNPNTDAYCNYAAGVVRSYNSSDSSAFSDWYPSVSTYV